MKGSQGIPALKLVTLNKLIEKMEKAPNLFFLNFFPSQPYDSDEIKWEIEYSSGGMTPFVAPGSPAPTVGLDGISRQRAAAAYWKEKMYFDESFLNNLRQPGSWATYQVAERQIAKGVRKLRYRSERRREWMCAKALIDGAFTYQTNGGARFTVSYGTPASHLVTLAANRQWGTGADRNPVEDIFDGKIVLSEDAGVVAKYAVLNSATLKLLLFDPSIQALLQKSAFGEGDLFARPSQVLGQLLGLGTLMLYDELFEVTGWLTGNVTANATVNIPVDDASDFEVGGTLRFIDTSEYDTYEDEEITGVNKVTNVITVANAPSIGFTAGEDKVVMKKKFVPDRRFMIFSDTVDGENIGEFLEAPYGNDRRWGYYADTHDEWDPEGTWLRVQDKGLPVLYHPDTSYILTV